MTAIRPPVTGIPACGIGEVTHARTSERPTRSLELHKVLLATDGRSLADGATRLASALSARRGAVIEAAAVYEPRVPVPPPRDPAGQQVEARERPELAVLGARVREQLRRIDIAGAQWPLYIVAGYPAAMVERIARRAAVDLVLAGLGPAAPEDRRYTRETALALAFASDVPVLATSCDAHRLPRRAMVVVDAAEAASVAAQAAAQLVDDGGEVYLAVTRRTGDDPVRCSSWALERLFRRIEERASRPGVQFRRLVLEGQPVPAIRRAAQSHGVEMLAVAMSGASVAQRSLIDSMVAPLLRTATCSVLVVPTDRIIARE